MMTKAVLLEDVVSHLRPNDVYGRKYEVVNVIKEQDDGVLLMEGKNTFPVTQNKVKFLPDLDLQRFIIQMSVIKRLSEEKKSKETIAGIAAANKKISQILFL